MGNKYLVSYSYIDNHGDNKTRIDNIVVAVDGEVNEETIKDIEKYLLTKSKNKSVCSYDGFFFRVISFTKLFKDNENNSGRVLKYV